MRPSAFLWALVLAGAGVSLAQSPTPPNAFERGSISDNIYANQPLGITWEFPKEWAVQNEGTSLLSDKYHVMLRLLPSGTQSKELVEIDYSTESDTARLVSLVQRKAWEPSGQVRYYTVGGGIPAGRNDYTSKDAPPRFLTVLNGQRRGALNLVFVAESAARIEELVQAALRIKVQPDWGSPDDLPQVTPGSLPRRIRVSQGVLNGMVDRNVQPTYPQAAREAGIQGPVMFLAHISTDGTMKNLFVLRGPPLLVQAALEAVTQWRYKPYVLNGNPIELETQITVNFTLR